MKTLNRIYGTITLLFFSFMFVWGGAQAIQTSDVSNEVQMFLDKTITTSTSTGIILASPRRNGVNHTFGALSGGILRLRIGRKIEDIHYTLAEVRANNTVNLQGITRNLCTSSTINIVSCGAGQQFSRGAIVELTVNAQTLNNKANLDRPSKTTQSGAYICGTVNQPCLFPGSFTTAQKNAFTYTNNNAFHFLFDSDLDVAQYYNPTDDAYYSFGSGSIGTATVTTAGKVQLASTGATISGSVISAEGAPLVVQSSNTTGTGGNTADIGKLPQLNISGLLAASFGISGSGSVNGSGTLTVNAGGVLQSKAPTASNQVWKADANKTAVWGSVPSPTIGITVADQGKLGDSTTQVETGTIMTLIANQFNSANDTIHITITGEYRDTGATNTIEIHLGGTKVASLISPASLNTTGIQSFIMHVYMQATSVGSSATVVTQAIFQTDEWTGGTVRSSDSDTINTTGTLVLELTSQFAASNASNYVQPFTYQVDFIDQ